MLTLQIEIEELPTLNEVKIYGLKKGKIQSIINDTELEKAPDDAYNSLAMCCKYRDEEVVKNHQ